MTERQKKRILAEHYRGTPDDKISTLVGLPILTVKETIEKYKKTGGGREGIDMSYSGGLGKGKAAEAKAMILRGMSITDVAKFFGVHHSTVSRWVKSGGILIRDLRNEVPVSTLDPDICEAVYIAKQSRTWKEVEAMFGLSRHPARAAYKVGKEAAENV